MHLMVYLTCYLRTISQQRFYIRLVGHCLVLFLRYLFVSEHSGLSLVCVFAFGNAKQWHFKVGLSFRFYPLRTLQAMRFDTRVAFFCARPLSFPKAALHMLVAFEVLTMLSKAPTEENFVPASRRVTIR